MFGSRILGGVDKLVHKVTGGDDKSKGPGAVGGTSDSSSKAKDLIGGFAGTANDLTKIAFLTV